MSAQQDLFLSEQHPVSRRWAVVEDDGRSVWLYLTEAETQRPVADCWLCNRAATPAEFDRAQRGQPLVPQTHAGPGATVTPPPAADHLRLRWSPDGQSVAVFFGTELTGFIARGHRRGFSRHIVVPGPFGNELDGELFQTVFTIEGK